MRRLSALCALAVLSIAVAHYNSSNLVYRMEQTGGLMKSSAELMAIAGARIVTAIFSA
jgi:hypothetical protein